MILGVVFFSFFFFGYALRPKLFFLFIHYSHATYGDHGEVVYCPVFLSAVRTVAARCKLSFALLQGLSQENVKRTKRITKERKASVAGKRK